MSCLSKKPIVYRISHISLKYPRRPATPFLSTMSYFDQRQNGPVVVFPVNADFDSNKAQRLILPALGDYKR